MGKNKKTILTAIGGIMCASLLVGCSNDEPQQGNSDVNNNEQKEHVHSFENYVSNNDATCLNDGTKTAKCTGCDQTDTVADTGSALGHSFTNYVSNNNATCLANSTKTAKCDRCDVTDTIEEDGTKLTHKMSETFSHNDKYHWRAATCGCGTVEDVEFHEFGNPTIVMPQGDVAGSKTYTCPCGYSFVEPYTTNDVIFNQKIVDKKFLRTEATCTERATYYYSDENGNKGTKWFTHGSFADHDLSYSVDAKGRYGFKCSKCGLDTTKDYSAKKDNELNSSNIIDMLSNTDLYFRHVSGYYVLETLLSKNLFIQKSGMINDKGEIDYMSNGIYSLINPISDNVFYSESGELEFTNGAVNKVNVSAEYSDYNDRDFLRSGIFSLTNFDFEYNADIDAYVGVSQERILTAKVKDGKIVDAALNGTKNTNNVLCSNEQLDALRTPAFEQVKEGNVYKISDDTCKHHFIFKTANKANERACIYCTKCGLSSDDVGDYSKKADSNLTNLEIADLLLNSTLVVGEYDNYSSHFIYKNGLYVEYNDNEEEYTSSFLYRTVNDKCAYLERCYFWNDEIENPDERVAYLAETTLNVEQYSFDVTDFATVDYKYDPVTKTYKGIINDEESAEIEIKNGKITNLTCYRYNQPKYALDNEFSYPVESINALLTPGFEITVREYEVTIEPGNGYQCFFLDKFIDSDSVAEAYLKGIYDLDYNKKSSSTYDSETGKIVSINSGSEEVVANIINLNTDRTELSFTQDKVQIIFKGRNENGKYSDIIGLDVSGYYFFNDSRTTYQFGIEHYEDTDYVSYSYKWDDDMSDWVVIAKNEAKYGEDDFIILENNYVYDEATKDFILVRGYNATIDFDTYYRYIDEYKYDDTTGVVSDYTKKVLDNHGNELLTEYYEPDANDNLICLSKAETEIDSETGMITRTTSLRNSSNEMYVRSIEAHIYDKYEEELYHTRVDFNEDGTVSYASGIRREVNEKGEQIRAEQLVYMNDTNEWKVAMGSRAEYDEETKTSIVITYVPNSQGVLTDVNKNIRVFDDNHNVILEETWDYYSDKNAFVGSYKVEYGYDENGRVISQITYEWDDEKNCFVRVEKLTFVLNSNGSNIGEAKYFWNEEQQAYLPIYDTYYVYEKYSIVDGNAEYYQYTSGWKLAVHTTCKGWSNEYHQFIADSQKVYNYDDQGRIDNEIHLNNPTKTMEGLVAFEKYVYTYDENGNTVKIDVYSYDITKGDDPWVYQSSITPNAQ